MRIHVNIGRRATRFVFALLLSGLMTAQAAAVEIPEGTHLLLRMVNSITTRTARPGDYFYTRTQTPISVNNRIVVPPNSYVQGTVTYAERGGKVSGRAQLGLRLEMLTLPSGRTYKFSPSLASVDAGGTGQKLDQEENIIKQGPNHGTDAARIAITAGSGAFLGAIIDRSVRGASIGAGVGAGIGTAVVLLTRGREVALNQGSTIDVVFYRPVLLE
jgi:hypothetical protein